MLKFLRQAGRRTMHESEERFLKALEDADGAASDIGSLRARLREVHREIRRAAGASTAPPPPAALEKDEDDDDRHGAEVDHAHARVSVA